MARYHLHLEQNKMLKVANFRLVESLDRCSYLSSPAPIHGEPIGDGSPVWWSLSPAAWVSVDVPIHTCGLAEGFIRYIPTTLEEFETIIAHVECERVSQIMQGTTLVSGPPPAWPSSITSRPLEIARQLFADTVHLPHSCLPAYLPLSSCLRELRSCTVAGPFVIGIYSLSLVVYTDRGDVDLELPPFVRMETILDRLIQGGFVTPIDVPETLKAVQGHPALELRLRRNLRDGSGLYERRLLGTVLDYARYWPAGDFLRASSWRELLR